LNVNDEEAFFITFTTFQFRWMDTSSSRKKDGKVASDEMREYWATTC
jgi:hypothetical protein